MSVRVLIAGALPIIRRGLRGFIEASPAVTMVGEARDGPEALRLVAELQPDVVLLDADLPRMDDISILELIRREHPSMRCVLFSMEGSNHDVRAAFRAGAAGFVVRSDDLSSLPEIICAVHAGEVRVSASLVPELVAAEVATAPASTSHQRLSPRERQILQMIAQGKHSREIAQALGISARTVDTHRSNIMKKIDVHSVAALVRYEVLSHAG